MRTAVPGVVGGLIAAFGSMRLTMAAFSGLDVDSRVTYLFVGLQQVVIVVAGSVLPARVAGRINRLVALRAE